MQLRKQFNIPSLAPRGAGGSGKDEARGGWVTQMVADLLKCWLGSSESNHRPLAAMDTKAAACKNARW